MGAPTNIFGTDGVRDRSGEGALAPASLRRLGTAIARHVERRGGGRGARILFGRDTRCSGPEIEAHLAGALHAGGCRVTSAGVITTPAVSLLLEPGGFDLGVVISASHNPPLFNGVKLLQSDGSKLAVDDEIAITRDYAAAADPGTASAPPTIDGTLAERYRALVLGNDGRFGLAGLHVVLDCAYGAAVPLAPGIFRSAGARVTAICDTEDGERINVSCGSLHPEALARAVIRERADIGIAFDGDGDRAIAIDHTGEVVDGDEMIALLALAFAEAGQLPGAAVVVTVMTNSGTEAYLRARGIDVVRVPVGDREVARALADRGLVLGGEQSGHIMFAREAATGDGIRTGLHIAHLVANRRRPLAELRAAITRYPQTLVSARIVRRVPFEDEPRIRRVHEEAQAAFAGRGRVFLRYSGTEPLARVLVEGPDAGENATWAKRIAVTIEDSLG